MNCLATETAVAAFEKVQEDLHILSQLAFRAHRFEGSTELHLRAKEDVKRAFDLLLSFARIASSLESHVVHSDEPRAISRHHCKWRCVEGQLGIRRGHHASSHSGELMHTGIGAENRKVIDTDMTRQPREARDDAVRADLAIVADMGAVHDEVVIAYARAATAGLRADVNRRVFTNYVVAANLETRSFVAGRLMLWWPTEASEGMNFAARTDARVPHDRDVGPNANVVVQFDVRPHIRQRTHLRRFREPRSRVDHGARVNIRHPRLSPSR